MPVETVGQIEAAPQAHLAAQLDIVHLTEQQQSEVVRLADQFVDSSEANHGFLLHDLRGLITEDLYNIATAPRDRNTPESSEALRLFTGALFNPFPRNSPSVSSWDEVPSSIRALPGFTAGPYTKGYARVPPNEPLRILM